MATPIKQPADQPKDIRRSLTINPLAIQQEYVEMTPLLGKWVERAVEAARVHRLAKLDLEVVEEQMKSSARRAELEFEVFEENLRLETRAANEKAVADAGKSASPKRMTVDELNALVVTNPAYRVAKEKMIRDSEVKSRKEYQEAKRHEVQANADRESADGMVESLRTKRDMLVSLGADLRSEKEGDPSIRERRR